MAIFFFFLHTHLLKQQEVALRVHLAKRNITLTHINPVSDLSIPSIQLSTVSMTNQN